MNIRDNFKSVFDNDYCGADEFIAKVIKPIFGDKDVEVLEPSIHNPTNADEDTLRKANIEDILWVATIDRVGTDPIQVFDITLGDSTNLSRARVGIQRIIRSALFPYSHAFLLFHHRVLGYAEWRFSYVYKQDKNANTTDAKRYTYLFSRELHARTAIDRFEALANSRKDNDALLDAFNVEALSDDFFEKYRTQYAKFVKYITGKEYIKEGGKYVEKSTGEPNEKLYSAFGRDDKAVRDYVKKMMGRITFLHFLQRKGWMNSDKNFMLHLFQQSRQKADYMDKVLEPLFFGILNTKLEDRNSLFKKAGWNLELLGEWKGLPYLNGGLFEQEPFDCKKAVFPEEYFASLFQFFSEYNFTVDENDPDDAEVGVDPEMLGKIFENLLEDNKDKGAFYTPKEIVRYMCQESLIAYLVEKTKIEENTIRGFVTQPYDVAESLSAKDSDELFDALVAVKICDPAIGSGAFPMGLLNELVRCEEALVLGKEKNNDRAHLKREIIKNNIYGVDIEKGAVDIARLRFWLSLVVDEEEPSPLPNLDYKIMQGNSLLESYMGIDLSHLIEESAERDIFSEAVEPIQEQLEQKKDEYYSCGDHAKKAQLKEDIKNLIIQQLETKGINLDLSDIDVAGNTHFFLWHTWFADVFKRPSDCNVVSGFDIVIGNPPYVEAKKLKYIASTLKGLYQVYSGTADLSIYFNELGFNLLADAGILSFITTNKFFNTGYGQKVREQLSARKINILLNFEQVEVFEDILVSSVILNVSKTDRISGNEFVYEKFYKLNCQQFKTAFIERLNNLGVYSQDALGDREWSFSDRDQLMLKEKIERDSIALGNIDGVNVYRGVTTGYNPAFIVTDEVRDSLINADGNSRNVIHNMLQGRNIRKWFYNESNENLVFTRKGIDIDKFPAIKKHLKQYYNKLKPKTEEDDEEGRKPGNYQWYEILDNTAYYREFEAGEKIIWGLTADKWAFTIDKKQHYLPSNAYILTSTKLSIGYILGLLNSKLMKHYFGYIGVMTAGGAYTLKAATITALPFKIAGSDVMSSISGIVEQILKDKSDNNNSDVSTLESQIDNLVYKIYGLTQSEVALVED